MQLTKRKKTKLLIVFILTVLCFCLIVAKSQILTSTQEIIVDVDRVIADFSSNPIGMNVNFLLDTESIVKLTQKLHIGSLRYPMGEIADYYLFDRNHPSKPKIAIRDSRFWLAKFTNTDGTWKNPLDFDRFIRICHAVNAEPFVVVGIDALAYSGNSPHAASDEILQAAVDWVEYANMIKGYSVKYWEIGNENDIPDDRLNWTAEKYAKAVVMFSRAMKQVDPSIKIGVNGMTGMTWWDKVMPIVKDDVDFLVTHQYSSMQNYQQWHSNTWNYNKNIEIADLAIEKYNPNLKLNVTENSSFNPGQPHANNIWKMLHNFEMMGNTLLFGRLEYLHFWISQWFSHNPYISDASLFSQNYELMPMAYSLRIWGTFIHQQMISTVNQTGNIRSWASYDPINKSLSIFLLNKEQQAQKVVVKIKNYGRAEKIKKLVLYGNSPYVVEPIWQQINNHKLFRKSKVFLKLKPLSITVIDENLNS